MSITQINESERQNLVALINSEARYKQSNAPRTLERLNKSYVVVEEENCKSGRHEYGGVKGSIINAVGNPESFGFMQQVYSRTGGHPITLHHIIDRATNLCAIWNLLKRLVDADVRRLNYRFSFNSQTGRTDFILDNPEVDEIITRQTLAAFKEYINSFRQERDINRPVIEIAGEADLQDLIVWNPGNLMIGPDGQYRSDDPSKLQDPCERKVLQDMKQEIFTIAEEQTKQALHMNTEQREDIEYFKKANKCLGSFFSCWTKIFKQGIKTSVFELHDQGNQKKLRFKKLLVTQGSNTSKACSDYLRNTSVKI